MYRPAINTGVYVDMDNLRGTCGTLRVSSIGIGHCRADLELKLRTADYGFRRFVIGFDELGLNRDCGLVMPWWQQRCDSLYIVLMRTLLPQESEKYARKHVFYLLSIRVDPAAYGRWEFSEIPGSRKKALTDVLVASFGGYDLCVPHTELKNNEYFKDGYLGYLCGDILSIIDDMVNWPLRARDITVMFTPFTRSNVTITSEHHSYDNKSQQDHLYVTGYHTDCFMPGVKIVSLTPTKIVLLGTRHCGIRLTNSLYSFTHEDHLKLMNVEDIRTVLTKVTTRPPCPLFSLQKSTTDSKWFAVYENPTGDWLYQDVDVSDVTMDNYHVLSVGGNNYRVSLKPKTGGRAVRCTVDRTGKLVFY